MSIREFIRQNREVVDACIFFGVPRTKLNDAGRERRILNDRVLLDWVRSEGVRV